MTAKHFHAVVIGDGQGGDPLARAFAQAGKTTAVVERGPMGGTCVNTGCTPTKTMAASARIAHLVRRAGDYGVQATVEGVDLARVRQRKREVVESFRGSTEKNTGKAGVTQIRGEAQFTGPKTLQVRLNDGGTQEITADLVFIDTGQKPSAPPIVGLDDVPYLTYVSLEELDQVPAHLIILGGSYIAVEFGQMFRRFGSEVTLIERAPRLMSREDEDVSAEVENILRQDGLTVHIGSESRRVERADSDVRVIIQTPQGEQTISGSHFLVAAGVKPNTDDLGLEAAGIETDERGYVKVNERLETTAPGVYAIGDVKGGPAFTHISYDDFRILKANLLDGGNRTTTDRPVPYTVFMDPQLGRIGLSEHEARDKGHRIKVAKLPMSEVARAIETDETRGFMKAVVDSDTGQILGAAVLGVEGGEIMAVLEVAMLGGLPYTALRDGVFAHPTLAESLNNLFMALED